MIKTTALLAFVLATITGTTGASAQVDQPSSVTVRYDDLNVNSDAGRTQLHRRMVSAARIVCDANTGGTVQLVTRVLTDHCLKETMARAEATFAARNTVIASR